MASGPPAVTVISVRQLVEGLENIKAGLEGERRSAGDAPRRAALAAIKLMHTLAWFSIESCMVYVLWTGFRRQSDRRTAVAAGVVATETLIFAANGFRCPLTQIAERAGAERGSVTDIYLPPSFARNLPAIHVPLILLAAYLHRQNLRGADHLNDQCRLWGRHSAGIRTPGRDVLSLHIWTGPRRVSETGARP